MDIAAVNKFPLFNLSPPLLLAWRLHRINVFYCFDWIYEPVTTYCFSLQSLFINLIRKSILLLQNASLAASKDAPKDALKWNGPVGSLQYM